LTERKTASPNRCFVINHICEMLIASLAEVDGNVVLSRRLHVQANLRLITMSEEELWELAGFITSPTNSTIQKEFNELKERVEYLKRNSSSWEGDLKPQS
jgi:hypothetical protein